MQQQKRNLFNNSNRIKEIPEKKRRLLSLYPPEISEEMLLVKAILHLIHSLLSKKRPPRANIIK
jgi:hypothetical protein